MYFAHLQNGDVFSCPRSTASWTEAEPHSSVDSIGLENRRSLVRYPAQPIFFLRIDDSHGEGSHSSLTAVRRFDHGYVGKQPVAWKEYCMEYWLKEL